MHLQRTVDIIGIPSNAALKRFAAEESKKILRTSLIESIIRVAMMQIRTLV